MRTAMWGILLFALASLGQVPNNGTTSTKPVEVRRWQFPYQGRVFEVSFSRTPEGVGYLDIEMEGGGPGPGSKAQLPYIKLVLENIKSSGVDLHSLRYISAPIFLDDLTPLAVACVHSSVCRRTMRAGESKTGLQLVIKMLNEGNELAPYNDLLKSYGLISDVWDADELFVKRFKDYQIASVEDQRFVNALVPANLTVTLRVRPVSGGPSLTIPK
jgi:hypothetical protein